MVRNFRDLSQYLDKNGKHLPKGKFLRSAALTELKVKDVEHLCKYKPITVIDLRTETEISEHPDFMFETYIKIPVLRGKTAGISHENDSTEHLSKIVPVMTDLYAKFIKDDYCLNKIGEALKTICEFSGEGAILWHCSEGKDRCGIVSALFLKLMGFDDDVVYKDYLKSSKSANKQAWKYYFLIRVFRKNKVLAKSVKNAFMVKREYLESAFKEIENRFGSVDNLFDYFEITEETRLNMRKKYLV